MAKTEPNKIPLVQFLTKVSISPRDKFVVMKMLKGQEMTTKQWKSALSKINGITYKISE